MDNVKKWVCYNFPDRCGLRSTKLGRSMTKVQELFAEAQKDFPGLEPEDVSIVVYDGNDGSGLRGILGIEFTVPDPKLLPPDYHGIEEIPSRPF